MWKIGILILPLFFLCECFVVIKVGWKGNVYYIFNVYYSCSINLKSKSWEELIIFKRKGLYGKWHIISDFNDIKKVGERKG